MKVLLVDDDASNRESIARYLSRSGIEVTTAENGRSGLRLLESEVFDVAVMDLRMPEMDGLELLEWLSTRGPRVPAVMISAYGEVRDAVAAMKLGAEDYLVKPFDPEELVIRLRRIAEARTVADIVESSRSSPESVFLGTSEQMRKIDADINRIAQTVSNVLITGESGTGKEVIAREIHARSNRSGELFVPVNLGGIPETLLESELFGYEKGAFTGADARKIGMFELASKGTLFLDEIGEISPVLQVKLLRAVQDRAIRRLGGTQQIPVGARIIAATNRDLAAEVDSGGFREDLYYRLNVLAVHVPPLSARLEDLPQLCGVVLAKLARKLGRTVSRISADGLRKLQNYSFPGNVRELENILERAVIFSDGETIRDADLLIPQSGAVPPPPRTLEAIEREAIFNALSRWDGNRTRAAEELGISRRTLLYKLKSYGVH
ncbi:MAG: sigma-54-dependent Fis family transcriptional regulator [Spirochaetales bacterium]|nr:sigma-54-dependent Fis family transcriptional regulator [Spirochaetales bacterium]